MVDISQETREDKSTRIRVHLSLLVSRIIEKKFSTSGLIVERTAEILWSIKVILVKSPLNIMYNSGSKEAKGILCEMGLKPPDRILVSALPETD
ncbi:MAG: hypothetical protein QXU18_02090 [Thermoplasmatales archaeon]